jgi:signal transduction histidine kinase
MTLGVPREVHRFVNGLVRPVADACAVVILDDGGTVRHATATHVDERLAPAMRGVAEAMATSTRLTLRRLVASGRPFLLTSDDEALSDAAMREALASIGARSLACVPLARHVSGLVVLASTTTDRWDGHDAAALRAFGASIAALITADHVRAEAEELIGDIHHDLGNPLHAITLNLELLLSRLPQDDRRASRPTLELMRQAARRMGQLLGELDEYLHGRRNPEAATTSVIVTAVEEVVATLGPVAAERAIALEADVADPALDAEIPPRQLFRVLSNLVGNAIKYTNARTSVRISAVAAGDRVRLAVEDSGPGIADADCARLFDREWLASSSLRKGTGLGLAIAKRLVEARGGSISVVSQVGYGTRFVVELPRVVTDEAPLQSALR